MTGRPKSLVTIGRYRMREELGRGGFGAVYVAHDPELGRDVAVKVLRPRKGRTDGKWEARMVREAQTLAQLEHPNVVSVYDVGVDAGSGGVYIVMELLPGRSARAWVKDEVRPAWQHVVQAFVDAARGLAAAHGAGVVHRDFKPDNLMLGPDGAATVIDFGLARDVDDLDSTRSSEASGELVTDSSSASGAGTLRGALTSIGTVMGTPPYMPPEQHEAIGTTTVGPAADQYALCVSLFEVLYRVRPFIAEDIDALYHAKRSVKVSPLPKHHGVPRAVHRVLMRGLQPDADARYPSMSALAEALEGAAKPNVGRIVAGAFGVLAVSLGVAVTLGSAAEPDPCETLRVQRDEVWTPARRETVEALGSVAFARMERRIEAWDAAVERACAVQRSQLPCLGQWLRDADAALDVLTVEEVNASAAVSVVDTLPAVAQCGTAHWAGRSAPLPIRDAFARARALAKAGQGEAALALVEATVEDARGSGDTGLLAQAALTAGVVYAERERLEEAREVLIEAVSLAWGAGLDGVGTEAAIVLIRVCGALGRFDDAHRWTAQAEAGLARVGDAVHLRRLFLGARVFALIYEGDFEQAYRLGLALVDLLPEDTLRFERGRAQANVAMAAFELGRMHEAIAVIAEARASLEAAVGQEHAAVGGVLADEGRYLAAAGRVDEGVDAMRRAVALMEIGGGARDPYALNAKRTLAHYLGRLGAFDESLAMLQSTYEGTVALYGLDHVRTAMTGYALADQYLMHDRPADALPLVRQSMTSLTSLFGGDDPRLAVGAELLGRGLALQNAFAEAREVVTSALAGLTDATPGERESKVNLTMVLAGIDQDEGRLDAAARNLERAIALCEGDPALRDPSMLASLEGSRAYVEAERGHAERAVLAARLALKYLDEIGVGVEEKAEFQQLIDAGGVVVAE